MPFTADRKPDAPSCSEPSEAVLLHELGGLFVVTTMVSTRSWLACCVRNGPIFLMLNSAERLDRATEDTCSEKVTNHDTQVPYNLRENEL